MYTHSYIKPISSSLASSYSHYVPNRQNDDFYSSMMNKNSYRRGGESLLSRSIYQIPPSSLRSSFQNLHSSYISSSPRMLERFETEPNSTQHIGGPQTKSDDLSEYMNYLFTQLDKSLQLNQELGSKYDSIEKQSKEISDENAKLKAIFKDMQLHSQTSNSEEQNRENEDIAELLKSKDKLIANLTNQFTILSMQKEHMVATLINYEKEIIEMGKSVEALSIDQSNQQLQSPEAEEDDKDQETDNSKFKETSELIEKIKQENNRLTIENHDKETQIDQLKTDMYNKLKKASAINNEVKQYPQKCAALLKKCDENDQILKKLKVKNDNLIKSSMNTGQSTHLNGEYKEKYDTEKEKNEQLKKSLNELKDINANLIESRNKLKEAYDNIVYKLQKKVDDSISKYKNIEEIMIENRELKKKNEIIENQLKSMPNMNESLDALKKLESESDYLRKRVQARDQQNEEEEENEEEGEDKEEENEGEDKEKENEGEDKEEENEGEDKEEEEATIKEEHKTSSQINTQPQSQHSFSIFTICLNKFIGYDFNKNSFKAVVPQNYAAFLKEYKQEESIYYNTLDGLFIITGSNSNQLYYYSQKTNTISLIIKLNENHSCGSMIMDQTTKSLIILSGEQTSKVEQFSFETVKHSYLPPMLQSRANASFCFLNRKLYGFFGFNNETLKALNTIECLNLDACSSWEYINYIPKSNRDYGMSHHLVVNIDDNRLLILGGINAEEINKKVIIMNINDGTIEEDETELPFIQESKFYMFDNNSQSNILLQNNALWNVAIDGMNNVHMIDGDLNYKIILFTN